MSNNWFTIFGPKDWPGVKINTGNKKIDGQYFNVLGDKNVQLSASGNMWLVGGSGIQLISQGFVDASGIRCKNLLYQDLKKIDSSGSIIPTHIGTTGSLMFKLDDNNISTIPNDKLVYNTGIGEITMPSYSYGPLFVSSGNIDNPESHQIESFTNIQYEKAVVDTQGTELSPPTVFIDGLTKITRGIQIYPNFEGYKGNILTHMGKDVPAEWAPAEYLKAEGVSWNKFVKRPIKIEDGKIIFYKDAPTWAQGQNLTTLDLDTLKKEFGTGFDTIEVLRNDTRETVYVKFAAQVRYGADQDIIDLETPLENLFEDITFIDPDGDPKVPVQGFSVKICSPIPWADKQAAIVNGFCFSVTKGAFLDMQLGRTAKEIYSCETDAALAATSLLKFKPSSMNSISIRPNTHTAFNMLGENIDFIVYGEKKTKYGNYEPSIFGLNENNIPSGLMPAFKIDANAPNAASGHPASGIYFVKHLDRAKTIPSGWNYDTKPKIMINTSGSYVVSSLVSGITTVDNISTTGYLYDYADLTVNSTIYSPNIIAQDIFLKPVPLKDNSGKYITNALLTLDSSGKIISRIPKQNPTAPGAPSGVRLDVDAATLGNGELSIMWDKPVNDGNSDIINYKVQFSNNDGANWSDIIIPYSIDRPTPISTKVTIKGLVSQDYQFRVAAQNSINFSNYSLPSEKIRPGTAVPKSPLNIIYTREFDDTIYSTVSLSWQAGQQGNSSILGYKIEESNDGIGWMNYNEELIPDLSTTIDGTESRLDYYYRISAYNSFGFSSYSYVYVSGNLIREEDPEVTEEKKNEALSNWDFGSILFTGVCSI
jgi:hypothetical protein